jgi:hypothetical protein
VVLSTSITSEAFGFICEVIQGEKGNEKDGGEREIPGSKKSWGSALARAHEISACAAVLKKGLEYML